MGHRVITVLSGKGLTKLGDFDPLNNRHESFETGFYLHRLYGKPLLKLELRNAEPGNKVIINNRTAGALPGQPSEALEEKEVELDKKYFQSDTFNTIQIAAVKRKHHDDLDDFEIGKCELFVYEQDDGG